MSPATPNLREKTLFSTVEAYPAPDKIDHRRATGNAIMDKGRIKVLHVVISLEMGGMENGLVNVARALPPGEFEVHACCLERSGPFAGNLPQPENVHVLHKPQGFSWKAVRDLNRLIRRLRPDVLHSHNLGPLMYASLASGMGGWCPVLHGEHHLPPPADFDRKRFLQRSVFYLGCRKVHTVSESLRQELIRHGLPADKLVTLRNGVDSERFQPGDRAAARQKIGGLPEDALVLGLVGRFMPWKGHVTLIEAFEKIAGRRPEARLLFVGGGGTDEAQVRARAQASRVAGRIHFAGFQRELTPYYQAMDAMVFPSTIEGLSNALLESLACGTPVLAHPACGSAEVITPGKDGWLAEIDTVEKLQAQLEALPAREALPAFGLAGREKILREFSLAVMVDRYRRLYLESAGRREGGN
jgi:glycosyltransferase involved in cell wall biosynthesis